MKKQPRRQYTPEEKAAALALYKANGENLRRTAREFRAANGQPVAASTLQRWIHEQAGNISGELRTQKVTDLLSGLSALALSALNELLQRLEDGEGTVKDLAVVMGVAIEKLALLQGGPTERVAVVDERLTDAERSARIAALFDAARARGARPVADRSDWAD